MEAFTHPDSAEKTSKMAHLEWRSCHRFRESWLIRRPSKADVTGSSSSASMFLMTPAAASAL